jgi:fructokinase
MNKKILGIGNAIIDIFVQVSDDYLKKNNLHKGSMKLISEDEFNKLISSIKIKKIVAGGSAANTMAGISYLNGNSFFIGKINNDEFGNLYKKSLEDAKVTFLYLKKKENLSTGASIILITPDSERTMCTYLGVSSQLAADDIKEEALLDKGLIFLEGYLWDKGNSEKMFKHVIKIAKKNKIKIAMSLSDIFCVQRHKKDFLKLLKDDLDILIGNENEMTELTNSKNLLSAVNKIKNTKKLIVITRNEKGSLAINNSNTIECESSKVKKILDLTGAGDLFAAGFLNEYVNNQISIKKCLVNGSILASKIIQKIGARI